MQQSTPAADPVTADPITAVCVVVDPNKCPPNYELLMRSHDKRDDCDLWKDGVFKSKVRRYLCFSRIVSGYGNATGSKEVLADLIIQNDKEIPPPEYRLVERTIDTGERATNKKQICIKMIPICATTDAISDIIILSKTKRAPPGFTSAGDVNGLLICYKMSKVTVTEDATEQSSASRTRNDQDGGNTYAVNWWGIPVSSQQKNQNPTYSEYSAERGPAAMDNLQHYDGNASFNYGRPTVPASGQSVHISNSNISEIITGQNALSDVPFRLNPKFADESSLAHLQGVPTPIYKSLIDIENEFDYVFNLESTTVNQTRM